MGQRMARQRVALEARLHLLERLEEQGKQLRLRGDAELGIDPLQMVARGLRRDGEPARDRLGRVALQQQVHHLALALGQDRRAEMTIGLAQAVMQRRAVVRGRTLNLVHPPHRFAHQRRGGRQPVVVAVREARAPAPPGDGDVGGAAGAERRQQAKLVANLEMAVIAGEIFAAQETFGRQLAQPEAALRRPGQEAVVEGIK